VKQGNSYGFTVEVALIPWPGDESRRASLLASGDPLLLLVSSGPPPVVTSPIEDWIRVPAPEIDLEARIEALRLRVRRAESKPILEEGGILRYGTGWAAVSPLEARLVATLLERNGTVVTRQALIESGWPQADERRADTHRGALDAHVLRLRHRLSSIGLTIRTIRSRGYLLDPLPSTHADTGVGSTSGLEESRQHVDRHQ